MVPFKRIPFSGSAWSEDVNRFQQNVAEWAAGVGAGLSVRDIASTAQHPTYIVETADQYLIADARGGPFKVVLPPPGVNQSVTVKNAYETRNALTIVRSDGRAMGGGLRSVVAAAGQSVTAISDGLQWWLTAAGASSTDGSARPSPSPSPIPPPVPPGPPVPPFDAAYWLSTASAALPSAVNLGALGTGVLQQSVQGGYAAPISQFLPEGAWLFGGANGLLDYDPTLFFVDKANVLVGIGTGSPSASVTMTIQRAVNGAAGVYATNSSAAARATAGFVAQADVSDTVTAGRHVSMSVLGRGFVPLADETYLQAGDALFYGVTDVGVLFAASGIVGTPLFGWRWVSNNFAFARQDLIMDLTYGTGELSLPVSLAGGGSDHLVYATDVGGRLTKVTLGAGLAFTGGTLSATGSGGTVTGVTASLPLTSSGGTTPNIAINYDGVSLDLATATTLRRAALTGDVTAAAGSNALTIASHAVTAPKFRQSAALSLVGNPTGSTADVVDITLGAGLSFSAGTLVATGSGGTVTGVSATLPLTSSGGTAPDIALNYDSASLTLTGGTTLQRAALSGDVNAGAGSNVLTFRNFAALSVLGRTANSVGAPGDIAATSGTGFPLREAAGSIGFGALQQAAVTNLVTDLASKVPNARTLAATSPILIDGGAGPLDLTADRTFSHAASGVTPGTYGNPTIEINAEGHVIDIDSNPVPVTYAYYTQDGTNTGNAGYLPTSGQQITVNDVVYCPGAAYSNVRLSIFLLSNTLTSGTATISVVSPSIAATLLTHTYNVGDPAGVITLVGTTGSVSSSDVYGLQLGLLGATTISSFAFSATVTFF